MVWLDFAVSPEKEPALLNLSDCLRKAEFQLAAEQVSESASNLNYQLQQELPNLLTAPVSSGACFSTVAGTVSLLQ